MREKEGMASGADYVRLKQKEEIQQKIDLGEREEDRD